MNIVSISYTNAERTSIKVATEDDEFNAPWPCRTWHNEYIQAWLSAGNEIEGTALPAIKDVAYNKNQELITASQGEIDAIAMAEYPAYERATWSTQEDEARAFLANESALTPNLNRIANRRGLSMDDLAQRVVKNADAFRTLAVEAAAIRQSLEDEIKSVVKQVEEGYMSLADGTVQIDMINWPGLPHDFLSGAA